MTGAWGVGRQVIFGLVFLSVCVGQKVYAQTDEELQAIVAVAQAEPDAKPVEASDALTYKWGPGPTIISADDRFVVHLRGRLGVDYGRIKDSSRVGSQDRNATEMRSGRLGVDGIAWKDIRYKFEVDFADSVVGIKDAYIEYIGLKGFKFRVGQTKEGVSLEEQTSGRHIALMERAGFTDAFQFQRRMGIRVLANGNIWAASAGIYGGTTNSSIGNQNDNAANEGNAFSIRVAVFPEIGNGGRLHAGAYFMMRDYKNDSDLLLKRYHQRPVAHTSDIRYVSTGELDGIKGDQVYGVELAGIFGPTWIESEWAWLKAKIKTGFNGLYKGRDSLEFQGGYVGVGWLVTGETRAYKNGAFNRVKVNNPVFDGGWGALALIGRVDYVDLVDAAADIFGGEQLSWIFGVNWYLNSHTIIKLNYTHSKIHDNLIGISNGIVDESGKNDVNSFTARMQIDW